jgi:hypothetical protein
MPMLREELNSGWLRRAGTAVTSQAEGVLPIGVWQIYRTPIRTKNQRA